jgi:hypothetical protein
MPSPSPTICAVSAEQRDVAQPDLAQALHELARVRAHAIAHQQRPS